MNCLNILSIIVPQGTLARVLVPRASMGVEITPLSENVLNNFYVNNSFLYNSIPQKENMFRENMFREDMIVSRKHVSRKYVSRKHASSANKSTANKYWSRILMRALARQWEFHEKREKWKIEKIQCPGFGRGTGWSLAWGLIHSAMEILYDLEAETFCIYSAQQRIIRSWNWSCCGFRTHAALKKDHHTSRIHAWYWY